MQLEMKLTRVIEKKLCQYSKSSIFIRLTKYLSVVLLPLNFTLLNRYYKRPTFKLISNLNKLIILVEMYIFCLNLFRKNDYFLLLPIIFEVIILLTTIKINKKISKVNLILLCMTLLTNLLLLYWLF